MESRTKEQELMALWEGLSKQGRESLLHYAGFLRFKEESAKQHKAERISDKCVRVSFASHE